VSDAANLDTLRSIHNKVADAYLALLAAVDKGGACEECGTINKHFIGLNPAVLGHINKFLAENDITALKVPEGKIDRLEKKGKVVSLPDYEAHERHAVGE
jgi:hypothetical protein